MTLQQGGQIYNKYRPVLLSFIYTCVLKVSSMSALSVLHLSASCRASAASCMRLFTWSISTRTWWIGTTISGSQLRNVLRAPQRRARFVPLLCLTVTCAHLHRLYGVLLKLLDVLFDQNHLLLEERGLLFQSLHVSEHSGHILEGLITALYTEKHTGLSVNGGT